MNITIYRGRTSNITVKVTSEIDINGMIGKLIVTKRNAERTIIINKVGNNSDPFVVFPITYNESLEYIAGRYDYEVIIYKADFSIVKNVVRGVLTIKYPLLVDPSFGNVNVNMWDDTHAWDDSEIWTD